MPAKYTCDICGREISWIERYTIKVTKDDAPYDEMYDVAYLCKTHLKMLTEYIKKALKK